MVGVERSFSEVVILTRGPLYFTPNLTLRRKKKRNPMKSLQPWRRYVSIFFVKQKWHFNDKPCVLGHTSIGHMAYWVVPYYSS